MATITIIFLEGWQFEKQRFTWMWRIHINIRLQNFIQLFWK